MTTIPIPGIQRELCLPPKFTHLRLPQQDTLSSALLEYIGNDRKFILAELPTGSGKTLVGYMLHKLLGIQTRYLCTTISLQEQVLRDFPDAVTIKGRRNYPCKLLADQWPNVTAEDCPSDPSEEDEEHCDIECPYKFQKVKAVSAPFSVLNMSYFLNEVNYVGKFDDSSLLIVDEFDTTEDALKGFIEVPITSADLKLLEMGPPEFKTKWESWKQWVQVSFPKASDIATRLDRARKIKYRETQKVDLPGTRESTRWGRLASRLSVLNAYLDESWVVEHDTKWNSFKFKPTVVGPFGEKFLWGHAKKVFGMSGYLNFHQEAVNTGIEGRPGKGFGVIRQDTLFPVENRPVIGVDPGIDLSHKVKQQNLPHLVTLVSKMLKAHEEENGVVHCVSYEISRYLQDHLPNPDGRLIFHGAVDRRGAIEKFKAQGGVLFSPSVERGEDFPYDVCRFIVVVKLPYPYLGDPQVSRRLYGSKDGRSWYTGKTVASLIQMAGRGVRAEDDRCVTYVLASDFKLFYLKNKRLFPRWFRDAVSFKKRKGSQLKEGLNARSK